MNSVWIMCCYCCTETLSPQWSRNGNFVVLPTVLIYLWPRQCHVTDVAEGTAIGNFFSRCEKYVALSCCQHPLSLWNCGCSPNWWESVPPLTQGKYILYFQHHRCRSTSTELRVFGLVDMSHEPAFGYMELVHGRDTATLLPIIQVHVEPNTIIHSDEWAA